MDDAALKLRRYKEEMESEEASLREEVRKAMDHALSLQRQAQDLDRWGLWRFWSLRTFIFVFFYFFHHFGAFFLIGKICLAMSAFFPCRLSSILSFTHPIIPLIHPNYLSLPFSPLYISIHHAALPSPLFCLRLILPPSHFTSI